MSDFYLIEGEAETYEEAIKLCSDVLRQNKCVKEDFYESCIDREKEYPTGLTEYCPVALPHTTKEHVIKEAVCALRLGKPVKFYSMEDVEKTVDVRIVLNMALLDDAEHIQIISRIVNNLKHKDFVDNLLSFPNGKLKDYLKEAIFSDEK